MTRRTAYERGRWVTLGAAALATLYVAPLAVAQEEDEDQPKRERSAIMVFETTDDMSDGEEHAVANAFVVSIGPDGGSSLKMFKMQDGKMVPVEGGDGMTIVTDRGGFGPRIFGHADFTGRGFAEFKEDHPTSDANDDGVLTFPEMRAFRVAKVMANSDAVMAQFPYADDNGDGTLDVNEAARLAGPGMMHPPPPPGLRVLRGPSRNRGGR